MSSSFARSHCGAAILACALALPGVALAQVPAAAPAAIPDVDLKLFDKSEVDRSKGCSVALWQANRDPDADRYAFVFIESLTGRNHVRQPARIKIGGEVVNLRRVATGGKNNGYDLFEYQLYKMPAADDFVVIELKLGELEGEAVDVESGTLSIVMKGRQVFRASVKGGAGCMTAPVAAPAPARAAAAPPAAARPAAAPPAADDHAGPFEKRRIDNRLVARELKAAAKKKFGCEDRMMNSNVIGFDLSEESAIWELPCQSFAYQASSVFALVYMPAPGKEHRFLTFEGPKGRKRTNEPGVLLNATWDVKARTVESISLGRASGDCGVLERYKVTAEGQFRLVEYREKTACDGKETKPQDFPLVFKAR